MSSKERRIEEKFEDLNVDIGNVDDENIALDDIKDLEGLLNGTENEKEIEDRKKKLEEKLKDKDPRVRKQIINRLTSGHENKYDDINVHVKDSLDNEKENKDKKENRKQKVKAKTEGPSKSANINEKSEPTRKDGNTAPNVDETDEDELLALAEGLDGMGFDDGLKKKIKRVEEEIEPYDKKLAEKIKSKLEKSGEDAFSDEMITKYAAQAMEKAGVDKEEAGEIKEKRNKNKPEKDGNENEEEKDDSLEKHKNEMIKDVKEWVENHDKEIAERLYKKIEEDPMSVDTGLIHRYSAEAKRREKERQEEEAGKDDGKGIEEESEMLAAQLNSELEHKKDLIDKRVGVVDEKIAGKLKKMLDDKGADSLSEDDIEKYAKKVRAKMKKEGADKVEEKESGEKPKEEKKSREDIVKGFIEEKIRPNDEKTAESLLARLEKKGADAISDEMLEKYEAEALKRREAKEQEAKNNEDVDKEDLEAQAKALEEENEKKKNARIELIRNELSQYDEKQAEELVEKVMENGPEAVSEAVLENLKKQHQQRLEAEEKARLEALKKDAEVKVRISEDEMTAYADFTPSEYGGKELSTGQVQHVAEEDGVKFGLDKEAIDKALAEMKKSQQPVENILIAAAKEAEEGEEGKVEASENFKDTDDENLDYKVMLVEEGTPLAKVYYEKEGAAGSKVTGKPILPETQPQKIKFKNKMNVSAEEQKGVAIFKSDIKGMAYLHEDYVEVKPYEDSEINIDVDDDKMKAKLSITAPVGDGKTLTHSQVMERLYNEGITFGVNDDVVTAAVSANTNRQNVEDLIVAVGMKPVNGDDAEFHRNVKKKEVREDIKTRRISHKDLLSKVISVSVGEKIATLTKPGEPVKDGKNVFGETVKAEAGKSLSVKVGDNVRSEKLEDGTIVYFSEIDGQLVQPAKEDYVVSVSPVYVIEGNVDMSVGNVYFKGDVNVSGDIYDDFVVETEGNIIVGGSIGSAKVSAKKNVIVENGIITKEKGYVKAGEEVSARFIENSIIEAGKDVKASRAILNSFVSSGGDVFSLGEKGMIYGGRIQATDSVVAMSIGTASGTKTEVYVGLDFELNKKHVEMKNDIKRYNKYMTELRDLIKKIQRQEKDVNKMTDKMKSIYFNALKKMKAIKNHIDTIKAQEEEILMEIDQSENSVIEIHGSLYPDVRIGIGRYQMDVTSKKDSLELFFNKKTFKIERRSVKERKEVKGEDGDSSQKGKGEDEKE